MKNKKLFIVIISLIFCCSVYLCQSTYAKYRKKVDQNVNISLASWNIKLNNQSIAGKQTVSGNIVPVFEANEYTAENVLAPGTTGYFDIDIDATGVDVSFSYELNVKVNDSDIYPDIIAYGYTLDPDNNNEVLDIPTDGMTGEIVHNTNSTKIRIYIKWDDSVNTSMDNAADTALAIKNSKIIMKATFLFSQIKNPN